jgi:hypothetical protein
MTTTTELIPTQRAHPDPHRWAWTDIPAELLPDLADSIRADLKAAGSARLWLALASVLHEIELRPAA